jgi:hypothetical protein
MIATDEGAPGSIAVAASRVRCREIEASDVEAIVRLLARGFPVRSVEEWACVLGRLREHPTPPGFPKYGYLLEHEDNPVGVLLLIFAAIPAGAGTCVRCNVSSWYTEPNFRSHAALLVSRALKQKNVTYLNITPAPHTLPILEAQGYHRYGSGVFLALPMLGPWRAGIHVTEAAPDLRAGDDLSPAEVALLGAHAGYGCLSLVCSAGGRRYPFVFVRRRKFGWLPYAHLVYCRALDEFPRFAGPIGRFLARRGLPLVALDANGPLSGLVGRYIESASPRCFRGPNRPRLGDLAFSERAMFGF